MGTLEYFYWYINSLLTADLANPLPSKLYEQHLIIYTHIRLGEARAGHTSQDQDITTMFVFWLLQFRRISSRALHRIMIFSHLNPGNENPSFYFTGKYFKTWIVLKIIRGSADKIFSIDTCKWVWQRQILPYCRWRNSRDQKVREQKYKGRKKEG